MDYARYALVLVALWVIFRIIRALWDSHRFGKLLDWLSLDELTMLKRASAGDADGVVRDICARFRERALLLTYQMERILPTVPDWYIDTVEHLTIRDEIRFMRMVIAEAEPFEIPPFEPHPLWTYPKELQPTFAPFVKEALAYKRNHLFFVSWILRHGKFVERPKGTA